MQQIAGTSELVWYNATTCKGFYLTMKSVGDCICMQVRLLVFFTTCFNWYMYLYFAMKLSASKWRDVLTKRRQISLGHPPCLIGAFAVHMKSFLV